MLTFICTRLTHQAAGRQGNRVRLHANCTPAAGGSSSRGRPAAHRQTCATPPDPAVQQRRVATVSPSNIWCLIGTAVDIAPVLASRRLPPDAAPSCRLGAGVISSATAAEAAAPTAMPRCALRSCGVGRLQTPADGAVCLPAAALNTARPQTADGTLADAGWRVAMLTAAMLKAVPACRAAALCRCPSPQLGVHSFLMLLKTLVDRAPVHARTCSMFWWACSVIANGETGATPCCTLLQNWPGPSFAVVSQFDAGRLPEFAQNVTVPKTCSQSTSTGAQQLHSSRDVAAGSLQSFLCRRSLEAHGQELLQGRLRRLGGWPQLPLSRWHRICS